MNNKGTISVAALALALACVPRAQADVILTYSDSFNGTVEGSTVLAPADASVTFSLDINTSKLTLTLTNSTTQAFADQQNLSALGFDIMNGSTALTGTAITGETTVTDPSASLVNAGGSSDITKNATVTPTTGSVTWDLTNTATFGGTSIGANSFVVSAGTSPINSSTNSIVGTQNGATQYVYNNVSPDSGCTTSGCGSPPTNFLIAPSSTFGGSNQDTNQFVYNSITLSFSVSGMTASTTISNVHFGFGPDGPDSDDWTFGQSGGGTLSGQAPEPAGLFLGGAGLFLLSALGFRRRTVAN
jgi:hypothetical protein